MFVLEIKLKTIIGWRPEKWMNTGPFSGVHAQSSNAAGLIPVPLHRKK